MNNFFVKPNSLEEQKIFNDHLAWNNFTDVAVENPNGRTVYEHRNKPNHVDNEFKKFCIYRTLVHPFHYTSVVASDNGTATIMLDHIVFNIPGFGTPTTTLVDFTENAASVTNQDYFSDDDQTSVTARRYKQSCWFTPSVHGTGTVNYTEQWAYGTDNSDSYWGYDGISYSDGNVTGTSGGSPSFRRGAGMMNTTFSSANTTRVIYSASDILTNHDGNNTIDGFAFQGYHVPSSSQPGGVAYMNYFSQLASVAYTRGDTISVTWTVNFG